MDFSSPTLWNNTDYSLFSAGENRVSKRNISILILEKLNHIRHNNVPLITTILYFIVTLNHKSKEFEVNPTKWITMSKYVLEITGNTLLSSLINRTCAIFEYYNWQLFQTKLTVTFNKTPTPYRNDTMTNNVGEQQLLCVAGRCYRSANSCTATCATEIISGCFVRVVCTESSSFNGRTERKTKLKQNALNPAWHKWPQITILTTTNLLKHCQCTCTLLLPLFPDPCCPTSTKRPFARTSPARQFCHYVTLYSSSHQIACFKVTAKSYNVATRTAEPRRVKISQNPQRSKAVLVTWSHAERGGGSEVLPRPWSMQFGDGYYSHHERTMCIRRLKCDKHCFQKQVY
jgi:hypothetical protein